jgi:hypothetical protein
VSFDFAKFMNVVNTLIQINGHDEAYCRCAVSRTFYVAWHNAQDYLHTEKNLKNIHTRDGVIELYTKSPHAPTRKIGLELKTFNTRRNEADYNQNPVKIFNKKNTESFIEDVHKLIADISFIKSTQPKFLAPQPTRTAP